MSLLSSLSYHDLCDINSDVNKLPYETELVDDWTPSTVKKKGDCDSHATAKQWILVKELGLAEEKTRLATCFVEEFQKKDELTGEWRMATKAERYHLVLLVDLGDETYVLCNRQELPMLSDRMPVPYEFHKIWSPSLNAWEWAKNADRSFG